MATTVDDTTQTRVAPPVSPPAVKPFPETAAGVTRFEGLSPNPQADAITTQYASQLSKLLGVNIRPTTAMTVTAPNPGTDYAGAYAAWGGGSTYFQPGNENPHTVVHELAHSYTLGMVGPRWLVEGIAEWAAKKVVPGTVAGALGQVFGQPGTDPASGYGPSAGFIEWLDHRQPGAAQSLANALRDGFYSDKWFAFHFGKKPGELMQMYDPTFDGAGTLPEDYHSISAYPQVLANQFRLTPQAEQAARVVADYQDAVFGRYITYPGSEEGRYSFADFTFDVVNALHRGPSYLEDLEARTMRMTSGAS